MNNTTKSLLNGVVFYSPINRTRKFYLPSTLNYFGPVKIERIMLDEGCSNMLLNFDDSNQMLSLLQAYPSYRQFRSLKDFCWKIDTDRGQYPVLIIKNDHVTECIEVSLMADQTRDRKIKLSKLRFALCREDIHFILNNHIQFLPILSVFDFQQLEVFKDCPINRRKYSILGQDILQKFTHLRHGPMAKGK
eukprot:gene7223-9854_t